MNAKIALLAAALLLCAHAGYAGYADGAKIGMTVNVDGEGFVLNPTVNKITITEVEKGSLAEGAGIVAGDEIVRIEGQAVMGRRAKELQPLMKFNAGETRTLRLKHADGKYFDARLTKPK